MLSQIWSYHANADRRHLPVVITVIFKGDSHLVDRAADQKLPIGAATYGILIERLTVGMSHLIDLKSAWEIGVTVGCLGWIDTSTLPWIRRVANRTGVIACISWSVYLRLRLLLVSNTINYRVLSYM